MSARKNNLHRKRVTALKGNKEKGAHSIHAVQLLIIQGEYIDYLFLGQNHNQAGKYSLKPPYCLFSHFII